MRRPRALPALFIALATLVACTRPPPNAPLLPPPGASSDGANSSSATPEAAGREAQGPLPIYPEDARLGSARAPVTVVVFLDLQCPFCARFLPTLRALRERYGDARLRLVFKHYPLPFHPHARDAALSAIRAHRAGGDAAFFRYLDLAFRDTRNLSKENLGQWEHEAVRVPGTTRRPSALTPEQQLERDLALVESAHVTGTPTVFINGVELAGAVPIEEFTTIIDTELLGVEEVRRGGGFAEYLDRVALNFRSRDERPPPPAAEPDDGVWRVPVGQSPVLGPNDALVTLIAFQDYQCPFCKRAEETLTLLRERYGSDLRIVLKQNPLPFHEHARPAANLAAEVQRRLGAAAVWKLHAAVFQAAPEGLGKDALVDLGVRIGLPRSAARRAVEQAGSDPLVQADQDLAFDVEARGTPHFFINGRRLAGAQPLQNFVELVDAALADARALVQRGTPRSDVYAVLMKEAREPPSPPILDIGPIPHDRPSLGPAGAPVVITIFSDFECPFCQRVVATLDALRKEFPRDVRLVWRNLPLSFHPRARAAANAALEARAQGGDTAFWKMHDLIFSGQRDLSDERLLEIGRRLSLDERALASALSTSRYEKVIAEDEALARRHDIQGTPAFVINGHFISGAQPIEVFRRTIRRALGKGR